MQKEREIDEEKTQCKLDTYRNARFLSPSNVPRRTFVIELSERFLWMNKKK